MNHLVSYAAGERACDNCGDVIFRPIECWSGHSYIICCKPECISAAKSHKKNKWVSLNEIRCTANDCTNFIPEGSYVRRNRLAVCSIACWKRRAAHGITPFECSHCGMHMLGHRTTGQHHFCNRGCYRLYLLEAGMKRARDFRSASRKILQRVRTSALPWCHPPRDTFSTFYFL